MRKKHIWLKVRQVPQKTDSSAAGRLPMVFEKVFKLLYKTKQKEKQRKQTISQSTSEKGCFKSHAVPTAGGLLWFRENRF